MSRPEVWITGIGAVTAVGAGTSALREALLAGQSGLRPLPEFDDFPGGPAPELPRSPAARHLDRSGRLFLFAAEEAWRDAGLDESEAGARHCAVIEGSSLGPVPDLLTASRIEFGNPENRKSRPARLLTFMTGAGGAVFAQAHGLGGAVYHLSAGSTSGLCAVGEGYQRIQRGLAEIVVAGGAECALQADVLGHFRAAGILAKPADGPPACRPFDVRRTGTLLGEGAGVLILESSAHARRRGAGPRAVLRGFAVVSEGYSMTAPDPAGTGVAEAARRALEGMPQKELGWIIAHGTGTLLNDAAECRGLATMLGDRLATTPLTSLKPTLGHCLGASGAVETASAVVALEAGVVPATLGTELIDPALPRCVVPTRVWDTNAKAVLILSEAFGGRCAALTLSQP